MDAHPLLLHVDAVTSGYGGPPVLREVSLDVHAGEIVTLLGPNGAGKTTLLNTICGRAHLHGGTVEIEGWRANGCPTHKIIARRVAYMPQGRRLFGDSLAIENIRIGAYAYPNRHEVDGHIEELADRWPVLKRVLHRRSALLSGGEQQFVALARALVSRPKLLLLDEPSLGLAPVAATPIAEAIGQLVVEDPSMAVVWVEQNVSQALEIAGRVCVLSNGSMAATGRCSDFGRDEIAGLYLGSHARATAVPTPQEK